MIFNILYPGIYITTKNSLPSFGNNNDSKTFKATLFKTAIVYCLQEISLCKYSEWLHIRLMSRFIWKNDNADVARLAPSMKCFRNGHFTLNSSFARSCLSLTDLSTALQAQYTSRLTAAIKTLTDVLRSPAHLGPYLYTGSNCISHKGSYCEFRLTAKISVHPSNWLASSLKACRLLAYSSRRFVTDKTFCLSANDWRQSAWGYWTGPVLIHIIC